MKRLLLVTTLIALIASPVLTSAPLEFVAKVTEVKEVDDATLLSLAITPTVSIDVRVTGLTEIKDESGLPITAADLAAGQTLKVEALFTESGILALEIEVLDDENEFELRGEIQEIGPGRQITLLGLVIQVPETAEIKDEFGDTLAFEALQVDDVVKVEGMTEGDELVAREIKKQSPDESFARISFLGIIVEFPANDQMVVALEGGVEVLVAITPDTDIKGTLALGALVKVNGLINSELYVTALKIQVKSLIELSPDELEMGFEETRQVDVILRTALEEDLTLQIQSEDPDIAQPSVDELTIAAGDLTASFEVTSGTTSGKTRINVVLPEAYGGASESVKVEVGEDEEDDEKDLEIKWTPRVVRAAPKAVREVSLFLKYGVAPEDLMVKLKLEEGPEGLVSFPEEVIIPKGEHRIRFNIELLAQPGKAIIRATLPEEVGGHSDDLRVELAPGQVKLKLRWVPDQVKTGLEAEVEVELKLDQPAPFEFTVPISAVNGSASLVEGMPAQVTFEEGEDEVEVEFSTRKQTGKVTFQARLPNELGGGHDDLKVIVGKN